MQHDVLEKNVRIQARTRSAGFMRFVGFLIHPGFFFNIQRKSPQKFNAVRFRACQPGLLPFFRSSKIELRRGAANPLSLFSKNLKQRRRNRLVSRGYWDGFLEIRAILARTGGLDENR